MSITMRISSFRKRMMECNISAALITSRSNVFYFSGFTGDSGDLIITNDACYILVDSRFTEQAAIEAAAFHVIDITNDFGAKVKEIISNSNILRLWYEDRHVTVAMHKGVEAKTAPAALIPIGDEIERLRLIKDGGEIENIKAGISEIEIAAELEYFMKKNGAMKTSFDTIAVSGANTSKPHGQPTEKIVNNGDLILLDYGCIYKGYASDITRTVALGDIGAKQKEVYNIVLYTQLKALSRLSLNGSLKETDAFSRRTLDSFGYGKYFGHALGHGAGLDVHEKPSFKDPEAKLLTGMVLTVEPGVYIPGEFGVRIEDMVLAGEDGIEILTKSPKELIIL